MLDHQKDHVIVETFQQAGFAHNPLPDEKFLDGLGLAFQSIEKPRVIKVRQI